MERREFLIGLAAALVVPPTLAALSGCSSSSSSPSSAEGFDVASSIATGASGYPHSHTVTVLLADLANPPAAGVSYLTSSSEGHTHQVTLSRSDLADLQEGKTRSETTTFVQGHAHTFTFRKP
jgi:hypothetical protein